MFCQWSVYFLNAMLTYYIISPCFYEFVHVYAYRSISWLAPINLNIMNQ